LNNAFTSARHIAPRAAATRAACCLRLAAPFLLIATRLSICLGAPAILTTCSLLRRARQAGPGPPHLPTLTCLLYHHTHPHRPTPPASRSPAWHAFARAPWRWACTRAFQAHYPHLQLPPPCPPPHLCKGPHSQELPACATTCHHTFLHTPPPSTAVQDSKQRHGSDTMCPALYPQLVPTFSGLQACTAGGIEPLFGLHSAGSPPSTNRWGQGSFHSGLTHACTHLPALPKAYHLHHH